MLGGSIDASPWGRAVNVLAPGPKTKESYGAIYAYVGRCPGCARVLAATLFPTANRRTIESVRQLQRELGEWTIQGLKVSPVYCQAVKVFLEGHSESCIWQPEEWPELDEPEEFVPAEEDEL
jgi:hypothetical protein